ncbi:MAG: hypothetical protein M1824_003672 [Vezdaea acicularis]|nr:MAG: hypothetical protein M1824_003672 [Vezdaea acicularis]
MPDNLPIFSEGEEVETLSEKVSSLLVIGGGRWTLSKDRKGIERDFQFSTFKKTWKFMNIVAEECMVQRHHPEWSNVRETSTLGLN